MTMLTLNDPRVPKTWDEAMTLAAEVAKKPFIRNLCHNTHLEVGDDGDIHIIFHSTRIVTYHHPYSLEGGRVTLRSGGWQTVTTKQRINLFTNLRVNQTNHVWYVTEPLSCTCGGREAGHTPGIHYVWFGQEDTDTMEYGDGDLYINEPELAAIHDRGQMPV